MGTTPVLLRLALSRSQVDSGEKIKGSDLSVCLQPQHSHKTRAEVPGLRPAFGCLVGSGGGVSAMFRHRFQWVTWNRLGTTLCMVRHECVYMSKTLMRLVYLDLGELLCGFHYVTLDPKVTLPRHLVC